ncbi:MAG: hypothetical protein HQL76_07005 [Magnetococcales bacterium]|nr:hypothetical protein [Magnetococcales bacterium]
MINAATLLKDLKGLLPGLEEDIRARLEEMPEEKARLVCNRPWPWRVISSA